MLRHKAMVQCARLAFGLVGVYDYDEAQRIVTGSPGQACNTGKSGLNTCRAAKAKAAKGVDALKEKLNSRPSSRV